jgi:hypothetical protein
VFLAWSSDERKAETLWGKRRRKKATWCGLKPLKMKPNEFFGFCKI